MKRKMHLVLALVLSGAVAFAEDPGNTDSSATHHFA